MIEIEIHSHLKPIAAIRCRFRRCSSLPRIFSPWSRQRVSHSSDSVTVINTSRARVILRGAAVIFGDFPKSLRRGAINRYRRTVRRRVVFAFGFRLLRRAPNVYLSSRELRPRRGTNAVAPSSAEFFPFRLTRDFFSRPGENPRETVSRVQSSRRGPAPPKKKTSDRVPCRPVPVVSPRPRRLAPPVFPDDDRPLDRKPRSRLSRQKRTSTVCRADSTRRRSKVPKFAGPADRHAPRRNHVLRECGLLSSRGDGAVSLLILPTGRVKSGGYIIPLGFPRPRNRGGANRRLAPL